MVLLGTSTSTEGGHNYTACFYQLNNFNHCSTQVTSALNNILPLFVLQIVTTKFPWQCKVPLQIKHSLYTLVSDQGMFHGQQLFLLLQG
jgi:hypothetical protein